MAQGDTALIGRLVVRGARGDPLVARLRLGHLLGGVELRAPGLPPAAILCVRRLGDPAPGALAVGGPAPRPSPAWERALAEALGRLAAGAARPALGAVPAGAEAVLFADRAELLACLAADWLGGRLAAGWWWRLLCPGEPRAATVAAWREAPGDLPGALGHLDASGLAAPFVAALGPAEAAAMAHGLAAAFGLRALAAAIAAGPGLAAPAALLPSPPRAAPLRPTSTESGASPPRHPPATPVAPPWPEAADTAALPAPQRLLLGLGLALLRRPAAARGTAFAHQAAAWYAAAGAPPASQPRALPGAAGPPWAPAARPPGPADPRGAPAPPVLPGETASGAAPLSPAGAGGPARPATGATAADGAAAEPAGGAWQEAPLVTPARAGDEAPAPAGPASPPWPEAVETAYGGLFYLVNLVLRLGLYGDFTTPEEPGIELSLWDCLALLGEALAGPALRDDPIWPLLAALAGRGEGEEPGAGFAPPTSWRVPPAWLAPLDTPGQWRCAAGAGRLRAWHPAGLWAIDVPAEADPAAQLARELAAYGVTPPALGAAPAPREGDLARWVDWLAAYARAYLAAVLDAREGAGLLLLAHRAWVYASAARLDVALSLNELPVAIRMAGLDRDPGWVPAGGRSVRLHFEGG